VKADSASYLTLLEELLAKGRTVTTRVRGSSMLPSIPDGAVVRLQPLSGNNVCLGEVVALRDAHGKLLCHRVTRLYTRKGERWVQTWGDVCRGPDEPVTADSVIGKVTTVVEGEVDALIVSRPAWRIRGRYLKHRLRNLLRLSSAQKKPLPCAIAGSEADGDR
jgi:signal peptidase I